MSAATVEEAERDRDRLIRELLEGRDPDSSATVNVLLDRWLAIADLS